MSEWIFSTPWWLPTAVAVAGVFLWLSGNKRSIPRLKSAGLAIMLLAGVWGLVSYLVKTDVEKVTAGSEQLVHAVVDEDWSKVEALLHERATITFHGGGTLYNGRADVVQGIKRRTKEGGLTSAFVASNEHDRRPAGIVTTLKIIAVLDKLAGQQVPGDFQFDWERTGNGWVITEIRIIQLGNRSGEDAKSQLPR